MSEKVKPWQQRKPKHHGRNEQQIGKSPRNSGGKRNSPSRLPDDRENPIRNDWNERWEK
jgi:hypothetical protein